jgi:hypothetical protein
MSGTTMHRSSGISYSGRYRPLAIGSSAACTYTGTCQARASLPAEPEWSGWMCVSRIAAGRAPGPNSASATLLIACALPAHAASMSTHPESERTR